MYIIENGISIDKLYKVHGNVNSLFFISNKYEYIFDFKHQW